MAAKMPISRVRSCVAMTRAVSTFSAPIATAMIDTASDTALRMAKLRSLLSTSLAVDAVTLPSASIELRTRESSAGPPPRSTLTWIIVTCRVR